MRALRSLALVAPVASRSLSVHNAQATRAPLQKVNFDDPTVYRDQSMYSLIKTLAILRMCSIEYIAKNSVALTKMCQKMFGSTLTYKFIVKHTIYTHFCAGENDQELNRTVKKMEKKKIGSVLDYAAEADPEGFTPSPGAEEAPDISMASLVNRSDIRYPMSEIRFDDNMKLYMMSIMHAALHSPAGAPGVTAVKLTGMCDPQLLARISAILMSIHQSWCKYVTHEKEPKLEECRVVMGVNRKHQLYVTYEQLKEGLRSYNPDRVFTEEEMEKVIQALDPRKVGKINYFEYKQVLTDAITATEPNEVEKILTEKLPKLNDVEKDLWAKLTWRVNLLAATASELDVRMLVDAEQTFYQVAIDTIVSRLQAKYNKDVPVVYNTYQCYLTYAEDRISNDLIRAKGLGYQWGGKVVRGAYVMQERKTAEEYAYTSPIWPTYEATGACYNAAAERVFRAFEDTPGNKYEVFFGTHNQQSLERITGQLLERPALHDRVSFGQLYGMRDNLTIPLATAGYKVYKYMPYGPVKETIQYLGRRAVENSSVLANGDTSETRMIKAELQRRITFQ